jgi:hypothetical protein
MRLAALVALLVSAIAVPRLAGAQQPLAPAVEQADDGEVPPTTAPPPAPPPPAPTVAPTPLALSPRTTMLLPAPQGWAYRVTEGPPTHEHRWGMFTAGIVTLSVAYVANLQAGIPTGEWFLDVPLIGPLMEISRLNGAGSGADPFIGWLDFMLVSDAIVQMGGLALTIAGAKTYRDKPGLQRIELVPCGAGAAIRGSF